MAGGAERDRTADLVIANDALSQLSYSPRPRSAYFAELAGEVNGDYASVAMIITARAVMILTELKTREG